MKVKRGFCLVTTAVFLCNSSCFWSLCSFWAAFFIALHHSLDFCILLNYLNIGTTNVAVFFWPFESRYYEIDGSLDPWFQFLLIIICILCVIWEGLLWKALLYKNISLVWRAMQTFMDQLVALERRVTIVATSLLTLLWMCDSRTGCARRKTLIDIWQEQAMKEWLRCMIFIVACCHNVKLCALAARAFRSQNQGAWSQVVLEDANAIFSYFLAGYVPVSWNSDDLHLNVIVLENALWKWVESLLKNTLKNLAFDKCYTLRTISSLPAV